MGKRFIPSQFSIIHIYQPISRWFVLGQKLDVNELIRLEKNAHSSDSDFTWNKNPVPALIGHLESHGTLPFQRQDYAVATLNDKAYIMGGVEENSGRFISGIEIIEADYFSLKIHHQAFNLSEPRKSPCVQVI